MMSMTPQTGFW